MADTASTTDAAKDAAAKTEPKSGPKKVQMHRTVHEIVTGIKPENRIEAGTIVTDDVANKYKLTTKSLEDLTDRGAVELVEVLKD